MESDDYIRSIIGILDNLRETSIGNVYVYYNNEMSCCHFLHTCTFGTLCKSKYNCAPSKKYWESFCITQDDSALISANRFLVANKGL